MIAKYTLSDGSRISVFLWSDFLEGEIWRGTCEVATINKKGQRSDHEVEKKLYTDDHGIYFMWRLAGSKVKEKVYLMDFDYLPYAALIHKLNQGIAKKDSWYVFNDDILATFLKESDKVAIKADLPVIEMIVPMMGIGLTGDKKVTVLCKLSEKQYTKDRWGYKITLVPDNEDPMIPPKHMYFSDFCSFLRKGIYALVDRETYKG